MNKKVVVGFLLAFLLLMGGLSIRAVIQDKDLISPGLTGGNGGEAGIALINITGTIGESSSWLQEGFTDTVSILEAIREVGQRSDIKALILRLDTPGGSAGASQEIALELDRLREQGKPVISSVGDVCASGGYWIACSTDHIVANGASMTGSIGVIMSVSNLEGLYEKLGIRNETLKSGEHKDIGSSFREMTMEERELLQEIIDDSYEQFLEQVKKGRQDKIEESKLLEIADGRIFTGQQALELGLVDSLGNFYDAVAVAEEMAGISAGHSELKELNNLNWWNRLPLNMLNPHLLSQPEHVELNF